MVIKESFYTHKMGTLVTLWVISGVHVDLLLFTSCCDKVFALQIIAFYNLNYCFRLQHILQPASLS